MNTGYFPGRLVVASGMSALAFAFGAGVAPAQRVSWSISGPKGGQIGQVSVAAECPYTQLFVGDYSVEKSTDHGSNWKPTPFSRGVLAQDPADPKTYYTLDFEGDDERLLKTTDGGSSFVEIPGAPKYIACLAVDPHDPDTLYAGWPTFICMVTCPPPNGGLVKSVDGGRHWTDTGHPRVGTSQILLDRSTPGTIYTTASRSEDGGLTWEPLGDLPASIWSIALGGSFPTVLYAGTDLGLFLSVDGGRSWRPGGLADEIVYCMASSPASDVLLAGTKTHGVFASRDGGSTWSPSDLGGADVYGIVFDPCDVFRVYAVGVDPEQRNVFISSDSGNHWQRSAQFLAGVGTIALDPNSRGQILATAFYPPSIVASADGGTHWSNAIPLPTSIRELTFDPGDSSLVYAAADGSPVIRSLNGGRSWEWGAFEDIVYQGWVVAAVEAGRAIVGTDRGIYLSVDRGATWALAYSGERVIALATTADSPVAYAIEDLSGDSAQEAFSLLRSTDSGSTWSVSHSFPGFGLRVVRDPKNPNVVYVGSSDVSGNPQISRSADGGRTFSSHPFPERDLSSFVVDPIDPATLYAGVGDCSDTGSCQAATVWMSKDSGVSWNPLYTPAKRCSISEVAITSDGSVLHAASDCGEIDIHLSSRTLSEVPAPADPGLVGR